MSAAMQMCVWFCHFVPEQLQRTIYVVCECQYFCASPKFRVIADNEICQFDFDVVRAPWDGEKRVLPMSPCYFGPMYVGTIIAGLLMC